MYRLTTLAFITLGVSLFLSSCGDGDTNVDPIPSLDTLEETSTTQQLIEEDLSWEHDEIYKMMIGLFGEPIDKFPYPVDSIFVQEVTEKDSLPAKFVAPLAFKLSDHEIMKSVSWVFNDYYLIDSLKRNNGIQKYWNELDIAQTKDCNAYAVSRLVLTDQTEIFIWALSYTSYEACPYYTGNLVFGTFLQSGEFSDCFLLGEYMGAGDPPSGMTRQISSLIYGDEKLDLHYHEEITEDMDDPRATQETKTNYKLKVLDGKVLAN